jgi:site-specific DNA-methyltransferase (adenine-specific)
VADTSDNPTGALFYGDNLDVMRRYVKDESVDLVYLDPPFNSNATYNVLFAEQDGVGSASQIKAFGDTWRWDQDAAEAFEELVELGDDISKAMQAFRLMLSESNMLAYLSMMAPRLLELRRVLKPSGSIYLHCDPTASHYLKLLLDAVFGPAFFQNEIIWCYNVGGKSKKRWARKHDTILFYSKRAKFFFDGKAAGVPRNTGTKSFGGKIGVDEQGRPYQDKLVKATGRYYRYYLDEPKIPEDWWADINSLQSGSAERSGYPTQKPVALLERIIQGSCPPEGVVLDPFCGCGTTVIASEKLSRRWIGIDITHLATHLIKSRLVDAFGDSVTYSVIGEPTTIEDALRLAEEDRDQFETWALGLVGARSNGKKKGADRGIDGRLYFHEKRGGKTRQVVISVKSGKIGVAHLRDLRGVVDREDAELGVLISLREPTPAMRTEAASAGFYHSGSEGVGTWGKHPRLQLLTIKELLDGKRVDMPPMSGSLTFPKMPTVERRRPTTQPLFRNLPDGNKPTEIFGSIPK